MHLFIAFCLGIIALALLPWALVVGAVLAVWALLFIGMIIIVIGCMVAPTVFVPITILLVIAYFIWWVAVTPDWFRRALRPCWVGFWITLGSMLGGLVAMSAQHVFGADDPTCIALLFAISAFFWVIGFAPRRDGLDAWVGRKTGWW